LPKNKGFAIISVIKYPLTVGSASGLNLATGTPTEDYKPVFKLACFLGQPRFFITSRDI